MPHAADRMLARIGATPLGTSAVRSLGFLSRTRLLPADAAAALIGRLADRPEDRSISVRRSLEGRRIRLTLDLTYSGCRDLLVAPHPGAPDTVTGKLLLALAREAELIVDVGANVGLYTYLAAAHLTRARIVTFEPSARLARLIAVNVTANGWQHRVTVRTEAIGAERGTLTFHLIRDSDTEYTLDPARIGGRPHDTVLVQVVPLDEVLRAAAVDPARTVLKIDVEGHERSALNGLRETLNQSGRRPDIVMEFLGHAIEHESVIEHVLEHDLTVYYVGPRGLTRLTSTRSLSPVHTMEFWNFLITSRPTDDLERVATQAGLKLDP